MSMELIINSLCVSCDACRLFCPENAILKSGQVYSIDTWICTICGICQDICPVDCVKLSVVNTLE